MTQENLAINPITSSPKEKLLAGTVVLFENEAIVIGYNVEDGGLSVLVPHNEGVDLVSACASGEFAELFLSCVSNQLHPVLERTNGIACGVWSDFGSVVFTFGLRRKGWSSQEFEGWTISFQEARDGIPTCLSQGRRNLSPSLHPIVLHVMGGQRR